MIIINTPTSLKEIKEKHGHFYESLVKAVMDIEKGIIGVDAEMHADIEQEMLLQGSNQANLWGFNITFENPYQIQYTSLINIRPGQGNRKMEVENPTIREKISEITRKLIVQQ